MFMKISTGRTFVGFVYCFLFGLMMAGATIASAVDMLKTGEIQIRATAPGMTATGGYLTIHNHGPEADRLVAVAADFAARAEIHTMIHENGVMKMRQLPDGIEIPAGGMVRLAPGGMHLMMMGLKQTLEAGQVLEIQLTFASGRTLRVQAHVKRPGDINTGDGGMSDGDDHSHDQSHGQSHDHSHDQSDS